MYEYVEYVLANYFNVAIGHSEGEAVSILRVHLASNPTLFNGVRAHIENALGDESFSWKEALSRNDVVTFEIEEGAREYARELLGRQVLKL
ncbi:MULTISPECIES: hypothetical protein [Pseudomonas]|uniref:hypothetical protein n=1 Tax=Pseudomonas TaxID=286 RepID=UPI0011A045A5|nr:MULTISPECIES: hypothetical protein [Pseudomonas]QEO78314.1 hypothetical protein ELZ14_12375 [Pseudomonas brassicacearum]WLG70618.1 hypothetical protein PSH71_12655 [Pseudomonas brassicacearum]